MKMKNAATATSGILILLSILLLYSCSRSDKKTAANRTDSNTTQSSQPSQSADELNVVFFGPWGFVVDNDGSVLALAPSLKGHKNLQAGAQEGLDVLPGGD